MAPSCPAGYTKFLVNCCYGGYSFSKAFIDEFEKRHPEKKRSMLLSRISEDRSDPDIVALFEEMGPEKSNGLYANISVVPVKTALAKYVKISEYDGDESIRVDYAAMKADICEKLVTAIEKGEETAGLVASYRGLGSLRKDDILWSYAGIE